MNIDQLKLVAVDEVKLPEVVYKSCQKEWLVTLALLEDTITNLERAGVVNANFAKFRGNKFRVVMIENKLDPTKTIDSIVSSCYSKKRLTYKVDEVIEALDYDMDLNEVCSSGIHFFLSREAAFCYEEIVTDGCHTLYYGNGVKRCEKNLENNRLHGPFIKYYPNGNKLFEVTYVNGVLHGSRFKYFESGRLAIDSTYVNGKLHGPCTRYYETGSKHHVTNFEAGVNKC